MSYSRFQRYSSSDGGAASARRSAAASPGYRQQYGRQCRTGQSHRHAHESTPGVSNNDLTTS